jgi:hypothetical protein
MRAIRLASVLAVTLLYAGGASAQPTPQQQEAVKANCRSDFMSNCMGVPRGGAEAFQCLKQNLAKLSPGCKQAVSAVGAAPAAAAAKPAAPAPAAATTATTPAPSTTTTSAPAPSTSTDTATQTVPSSAATTTTAPAPAATKQTAAPVPQTVTAPKTTVAAPPAAPAATPPQQRVIVVPPREVFAIVRTSCRADYAAYCSGVGMGGGRVVSCLQAKGASLSPSCKAALTALAR